jgi:hypothetical protein
MKKIGKFILGTLSAAAFAAGAYYVYKNFIKNDTDDFDEFDDDFDDLEDSDTDDNTPGNNGREYVTIQMDHEAADAKPEEAGENTAAADQNSATAE